MAAGGCVLVCLALTAIAEPTATGFGGPGDGSAMVLTKSGDGPGPRLPGGVLRLLNDLPSERNTVAFERTAGGLYGHVRATFRMRIGEGGDGVAFALLPTATFGERGPAPDDPKWEEPSIPGAFAVGFDTYDPPGGDPFNELGNIDGRPQREVSLHWDGVEQAKRLSPVEFRGGGFHDVAIDLRFEVGGAVAMVTIDGTPVYDRYFIPLVAPYECRVAFGARSGTATTTAEVDDLSVVFEEPTSAPPAPRRIRTFDGYVVHSANGSPVAEFDLPPISEEFGRIILSLTLEPPAGGWDPWDRCACVYAWDDQDRRFEIMRYITPYSHAYTWRVDVTEYQFMLRGKRKLGLNLGTIELPQDDPAKQKGFKVSVDLDYFPGSRAAGSFAVEPLWAGFPEYGNPEHPLDEFFQTRTVAVPKDATGAKVRIWVTGHGMSPSGNAAEFMVTTRTLTVNGKSFENTLWKTDNYLNPCRPQGGTWKYDRAGWAPGDVVTPWDVDISDLIRPGEMVTIGYKPQPYVNEHRASNQASHWVEGQAIFSRP
jgi:hypothetical protein